MNWTNQLELALRAAAVAQLGIALINLSLVRIMKWQPELDRLSLLTSEVFRVHVLFISLSVATFGLLTWRFATELASGTDPIARWLAAAIGIFWAVRSVMQWTHYSHTHWRGLRLRTALHWLLFLGYGSLGAVYLAAAFLTR
jgi:hypothetical protein